MPMKIQLKQINDRIHFRATGPDGCTVDFDGAADSEYGEGRGMRPMQTVLAAMVACAAVDLVEMFRKARQPLEGLEAEVEGERVKDVPAPFKHIHVHFRLHGEVDEKRARRFVRMSVEQYCSVAAMLEKTATITHSFEIVQGTVTA